MPPNCKGFCEFLLEKRGKAFVKVHKNAGDKLSKVWRTRVLTSALLCSILKNIKQAPYRGGKEPAMTSTMKRSYYFMSATRFAGRYFLLPFRYRPARNAQSA